MGLEKRFLNEKCLTEKQKEEICSGLKYIKRHLDYASNHPNFGHALNTALLRFEIIFKDIIDSGLCANPQFYKKVGDFFFKTTVELKKLGRKKESELSLAIALNYYGKSSVKIPSNIKENWINYSYGESDVLRTDW